MSRQFNNFINRLAKFNITINTPIEKFLQDLISVTHPLLLLECNNGHAFSIKTSSLYNKLIKFEKSDSSDKFCAECNKPVISGEEQKVINVCNDIGLEFVSFNRDTRSVCYVCPCGNKTLTHAHNILREGRKAQCPKCQNNSKRNDPKEVAKVFSDNGCELISEYKSRHDPVMYICCCGNIATITFGDFIRGKRCKEICKTRKYIATCQEKYGVDNMFQTEQAKQKSKETCMKKYGVEHCMQSPEIFKKAMSTSFHTRKIVKCKDFKWVVQGYEPFCIKDLLKDYDPSDIIAGEGSNVPNYMYTHNNKEYRWYPDIYIPSINRIYEIKSTWTYSRSFAKIKNKIEQCPVDCELRIYNRDGGLFEKITKDDNGIHYMYGDKFILGEDIQE